MSDGPQWLNQVILLVPTWKWLALVALFVIGWMAIPLLRFLVGKIKNFKIFHLHPEKQGFWYYFSRLDFERPAAWVLLSILWFSSVEALELGGRFEKNILILVKLVAAFSLLKLAYLAIEALGSVMHNFTAKTASTLDDHLVPLAVKSLKVLTVVLGVLIALQNFGVNVVSLLAGLGLGGLALALAAQDAAANLIGSIMILIDRPFSIGDWIKINDVEGNVESIGFRSTRIRTFYNSLITIPNSTVAKEKIDNMGLRPFRRVRQILGLHYDTPPKLIEEFCSRIRYIITNDPCVKKDSIQVAFTGFADSTLNVLVNFHLEVFDANEEQARTQKIFCEIIDIAKEMNVVFAYPTQTVYYQAGGVSEPARSTSQPQA